MAFSFWIDWLKEINTKYKTLHRLCKNGAFYTKKMKQDFQGVSLPHPTLSTVKCSTMASIRGPRNRGKFGDKHPYIHLFTSNRSQTGTGNPGCSHMQPALVCCEAWQLHSKNVAKNQPVSLCTQFLFLIMFLDIILELFSFIHLK